MQGEAVTTGLRKVTDDMKTKNRTDRSGAVPAAAVPQPAVSAPSGGNAPQFNPRRILIPQPVTVFHPGGNPPLFGLTPSFSRAVMNCCLG
jgi:hypothetical protein